MNRVPTVLGVLGLRWISYCKRLLPIAMLPSLKLHNSSHLIIGFDKKKLFFQPAIFRGENAVSFREGITV